MHVMYITYIIYILKILIHYISIIMQESWPSLYRFYIVEFMLYLTD